MDESPYSVRRRDSIRTRLITGFLLISFMPLFVSGLVLFSATIRGGKTQLIEQFETIAGYKEREIRTWLQTLQNGLEFNALEVSTKTGITTLIKSIPNTHTYREADRIVRIDMLSFVTQARLFDEIMVVDPLGKVILSTISSHNGLDLSTQGIFRPDVKDGYIQSSVRDSSFGDYAIMVIQPVLGDDQQPIAYLVGRANQGPLNAILAERDRLGQTGESYLVSSDRQALTPTRFINPRTDMMSEGVQAGIDARTNGSGVYDSYRNLPVVGVYHWIEELQSILLIEQELSESMRASYAVLAVSVSIGLSSAVIALVAALWVTRGIAEPVKELVETATQVANGNLDLTIFNVEWDESQPQDEIYVFSQAFDSMTAQLKQTLEGMERLIEQRTVELELRSAYLQAGADVSQTISAILDPDQLIQEVVSIIRERLGLYFVGLFLMDEKGEWAILAAGTGSAGQAMKSRGHRIRLGSGMIGWSIANQQPRIALEVGEDRIRLATPELPETRSEAALPLRSRGKVLGALSVQSTLPGAFNKDNIAVFQLMADQVGVVLDNARLYEESQDALATLQRLYGERTARVWDEWLRKQNRMSILSDELGVGPAPKDLNPAIMKVYQSGQSMRLENEAAPGIGEASPAEEVAIPIKVRGRTIGVIETHKNINGSPWTGREIELLEHIADQLAVALEGAQLYEDTQRNAEYERIISDITAKVRASTNINTIMRTAISELAGALKVPQGTIQLRVTNGGDGDGGS